MVRKRPIDETLQDLKQRFVMHRRPIMAGMGAVVVVFVIGMWALLSGLPGRDELRMLGEMPQATTLYDVHDRPVFTIPKSTKAFIELGFRLAQTSAKVKIVLSLFHVKR